MLRKFPDGEYSHTGSWGFLRANQLKHAGHPSPLVLNERGRGIKTDWREFELVYCYHGMDFEPYHPYVLNIFDGPQEHVAKYFERLIWPQHDHIKYVSLDCPMPDYGYRCKRKRDRADLDTKMSDYWRHVVDWDKVQAKCESITEWMLDPGLTFYDDPLTFKEYQAKKPITHVGHAHKHLIIGDSHAHSAYVPKSLVLRKDGRTLRGIIKKGIKKEIIDYGFDYRQVKSMTCYWGNIDIRHHLCRESDPVAATKALLKDYEQELLKHSAEIDIELVTPVPIEDESRKLPSTGYFEKTPFFGTRAQRQEIVDVFKTELWEMGQKRGWSVFEWPEHWYKMDGVEFMEQIMERPRSVHLARKFYRWDLVADVPNPNLAGPPVVKNLLSF